MLRSHNSNVSARTQQPRCDLCSRFAVFAAALGKTWLASHWRCLLKIPTLLCVMELKALMLHLFTSHHRDSGPRFKRPVSVFTSSESLGEETEVTQQCNKEVNVYRSLTFLVNKRWKQTILTHAAQLVRWPPVPCFPLRVLFGVTDRDLSQIGLHHHHKILLQQIPHMLSEMKLKCPPPPDVARCFPQLFPWTAVIHFGEWFAWPAWTSSSEGPWFEWMVLESAQSPLCCALWRTLRCQFSLALPAYEL